MKPAHALSALAFLAGAAQAQPYYPQTLPQVLAMKADNQARAYANAGHPGATAGAVLSFTASGFRFSNQPPLRFSPIGGYAYYIARCSDGPLPTARALPPRPALNYDTSLTMEVAQTIGGLSFMVGPAPPDALTGTWVAGVTQGRGASASAPVVLNGSLTPPPLDAGVVVLTVTPFYELKDASYQVSANLGGYIVKDPAAGDITRTGAPDNPVPIVGTLSGGRWAQGSGLLFIRAPGAVTAAPCPASGVFVTPLSAGQLGGLGISEAMPIGMGPGMTFVMDRGGAP